MKYKLTLRHYTREKSMAFHLLNMECKNFEDRIDFFVSQLDRLAGKTVKTDQAFTTVDSEGVDLFICSVVLIETDADLDKVEYFAKTFFVNPELRPTE